MERLCLLPKGRKCIILITLHLEEILNLGGKDVIPIFPGSGLDCI